jgi:hypothetical protein
MIEKYYEIQTAICKKYRSAWNPPPDDMKVGISLNVKDRVFPIHGLRHKMEGNTSGWYIWAGELSSDPDFFVPLHVLHLEQWCPMILKYLALEPGWRFLIDPEYEDVWYDKNLLEADKPYLALSQEAKIWNRAALNDSSMMVAKGDRALSALLHLHGLIMNGGVLNALEILEPKQLNDAIAGYEFFGLKSITLLLSKAKDILDRSIDLDTQEALLDSEYASIIPDDSFLVSIFERYLRDNPSDFAPLEV